MFKSKKPQAPSNLESMPTVRAAGPPDQWAEFRYNPDNMLSFPNRHPSHAGYTTWYSLTEGGTVSLVTPFSAPQALQFRLSDLPFEQWVELADGGGRPIPLALFVDVGGVRGRWLP